MPPEPLTPDKPEKVKYTRADVPRLTDFASRRYVIHTNLTREETQPFGAHMDAVFDEYERRFSAFTPRVRRPMDLYLFRTHVQYLAFLQQHEIEGENSGGMFVFQKGIRGLITWVQDRSREDIFTVLQHEGFHQFAFSYLGPNLPTWVNEGMAQYFEDGILVRGSMVLEMRPDTRLAGIQAAIKDRTALDLDKLLATTDEEWSKTLQDDVKKAGVLYEQSWSVVYFLVHADSGKYRPAFEQFLVLLNRGQAAPKAFRTAFGRQDLSPIKQRWQDYTLNLEPDDISTALRRMDFLGRGLRALANNDLPMPRNLEQLRTMLQRIRFRVTHTVSGRVTEMNALDEEMYRFPTGRLNQTTPFELLDPVKSDLPPRLTARGLRVIPLLVWSRDKDSKLVQQIEYKQ